MWRNEALVRERLAEIERATARTRSIRGDGLPPLRSRAPRVRRTMARLALTAAGMAVALAGALDATAVLAEEPTGGTAGRGHRA